MAVGVSGVAGYGSFLLAKWFGRGKAKDRDRGDGKDAASLEHKQ